MNERIKELAEQARKIPMGDSWTYSHPQEFEQRFAELIVRECMREIQTVKDYKNGYAEPDYANGFDDGMFVAIRTIEEHFGVEE
jgi:hypothetical protein